jgi:hypothetical protein
VYFARVLSRYEKETPMYDKTSQQNAKKPSSSRFSGIKSHFTKVPNLIIHDRSLTAVEKIVIIYIGSMTECFASHQNIANICGVSASSIKRTLVDMKSRKIVMWKKSFGKTNVYEILPRSGWEVDRNLAQSDLPPRSL